jgi:hypothetical protein
VLDRVAPFDPNPHAGALDRSYHGAMLTAGAVEDDERIARLHPQDAADVMRGGLVQHRVAADLHGLRVINSRWFHR